MYRCDPHFLPQWADEWNDFQSVVSDVMDVVDGGDDLLISVLRAGNDKAAGAPFGGNNSSAKVGKIAHELYTPAGYDLNKALPGSRLRPDAIDFVNGIVRDLKPFTKRGIIRGRAQMRKYLDYLNENFKRQGGWQGFVDYY